MLTTHEAKAMAKTLRRELAERDVALTHSEALEMVARQAGYADWNVLAAKLGDADQDTDGIDLQAGIPIFRIFDVAKAMEFYLDFLGFTVDWEHRFGENFPLYCQVSRGPLRLHLSEHAGDASPSARVFVYMKGVAAYQKELIGKNYRYMKPGIENAPWGAEMTVIDPFNNRVTFCEQE